jgi:type IX secretion system PorP/SprF family membrane protein
MKKYFAGFLLLLSLSSKGQIGVMNQYHFNYLSINPAMAGENGPFSIKGVVGNQFNGNLKFDQLSHVLVLDGQFYNKTGLAFQSSSDNYGVVSGNNFSLSLAKGVEVGDLQLKAGLNAGLALVPTYSLVGSNKKAAFTAGAGVMANYLGLFLGVSKPSLYISQKDEILRQPLFVNLGYISDIENFVTYNVNVLWSTLNDASNWDFNLKLWFDKRLALSGSYRINDIYPIYTKKTSFIPAAEYKFSNDMTLGLAYNSNTLRYSTAPVPNNPNFNVTGIFQFYLRYNLNDRKGDSWYYDQF